jgi:hypothetical protein
MATGVKEPVILEKDGITEYFDSKRDAYLKRLCPGATKIGSNRPKMNKAIKDHTAINGYFIYDALEHKQKKPENNRQKDTVLIKTQKPQPETNKPAPTFSAPETLPKSTETADVLQKYTEQIIKYPNLIVTGLLVQFLEITLPKISDNWWKEIVEPALNDDQIKMAKKENNNINSGLDLVPLINIIIFTCNWDKISWQCNFSIEDKSIVYDMKKVRNHTDHLSKSSYKNLGDILRDFDNIQRFLKLINVGQDNIDTVIGDLENIKREIMREIIEIA